MRLVCVANAPIPSQEANGVQTVQMCAAFAAAGHTVTLLSPSPAAEPSDSTATAIADQYGIEVDFAHRVLPRPRRLPGRGYLYALRAARAAKRAGADLVYSRSLKAAVACALRGREVILEVHPMSHLDRGGTALFRVLLRTGRLSHVVVVAARLRDELAARFPAARERIHVVHNATADVDQHAVPAALDGQFVVGYVGSFKPGKGVELIVEVARRAPWATFHLVGGELAELERLIGNAPHDARGTVARDAHGGVPNTDGGVPNTDGVVPGNVRAHGFVPHRDGHRYRLACDVLLAPFQHVDTPGGRTVRWMSPIKVFEYLAAGRAIVIADFDEHREVITEGVDGLFADPDDPAAWVAALERLRDDADLRVRLGRQARQAFLARHTVDARARAVLEPAMGTANGR